MTAQLLHVTAADCGVICTASVHTGVESSSGLTVSAGTEQAIGQVLWHRDSGPAVCLLWSLQQAPHLSAPHFPRL